MHAKYPRPPSPRSVTNKRTESERAREREKGSSTRTHPENKRLARVREGEEENREQRRRRCIINPRERISEPRDRGTLSLGQFENPSPGSPPAGLKRSCFSG